MNNIHDSLTQVEKVSRVEKNKSNSIKCHKPNSDDKNNTDSFKSTDLSDDDRLSARQKLKFAKTLIFIILGLIILLIFAKAGINSEAMDDAFVMVMPTFLSILGLVTAYYFDKR